MAGSTLWFNAACSKCRQALQLLRERGVHPELREYLKEPPARAEIEQLLSLLPDPRAAVRMREDAYGRSGLSDTSGAEQIAAAIEKAPILLERPIFVHGGKAVVARPPEKVLELLE